VLIASGVLSFLPSLAQAQQAEPDVVVDQGRRGEPARVEVGGQTLLVPIPEGWVLARGEAGSQLVLRAAGDDACMLDVKITADLSTSAAARFFDAFHTSLLRRGATVSRPRHNLNVDGFSNGARVEYELLASGKQEYLLVVWTGYRAGGAWVVSSFFPKKAAELYQDALTTLLDGIVDAPTENPTPAPESTTP
jgi:hypothetical protein